MQRLPNGQGHARLPDVQPGLPTLRSAHHPAAGDVAHTAGRVQQAPARYVGRVGAPWPPRGRAARAGQGATEYWPGQLAGVRAPTEDETPLSPQEVRVLMREFEVLRGCV